MIVEVIVTGKPCVLSLELSHSVEINKFVFDDAPEPLDEDIVKGPAMAVHADANACFYKAVGKRRRGELGALIAVENLRLARAHSIVQGFQREELFQSYWAAARPTRSG